MATITIEQTVKETKQFQIEAPAYLKDKYVASFYAVREDGNCTQVSVYKEGMFSILFLEAEHLMHSLPDATPIEKEEFDEAYQTALEQIKNHQP